MKVYLLLDRSGSMSSRWDESINALNEYVNGLKKKTKVYIAVFDTGRDGKLDYEIVRNTEKKNYDPIKPSEIQPRGMTPLFDAQSRLLNTVFEDNEDRAAVVFITDGQENSSKEFKKTDIKKLLDKAEKKDYEVLFLGVDFDAVVSEAANIGLGLNKTYSINASNLGAEMKGLATRTMAYATTGLRVDITDEDRMRAKAKKS